MHISELDYHLPEELIAQKPAWRRDRARLMTLDRARGTISVGQIRDLPNILERNDCVVVNDSRVMPARLRGRKTTGAHVEALLLREIEPHVWEAMVRPGRRFKPGTVIQFGRGGTVRAKVIDGPDGKTRYLKFEHESDIHALMDRIGEPPLPPYIKRKPGSRDRRRYQTVFANERGSIAAPTAGLHFTHSLLRNLEQKGVRIARVTLHVGFGTFKPVTVEQIEDHEVDAEHYRIGPTAADRIRATRTDAGRIVAVGTTVCRTLETAACPDGSVPTADGETRLYIRPGYTFRAVDALLTNFHLPKTSLLALVMAFAGKDFVIEAYERAVKEKFRFYSYGDAMLIL
ncbi:MAG: tRNA preQ1(34) S-adenosylmethionine ribosyltransferase-isomerase QueA [Candidatus Hydrogenedentes bacterium]|nr:tRNA preQ1(34) S-adenosylmethionine ribosyltransferase-isomerase QueA [Candidatus Hydrogenedentota bacterium]